MSRPDDGFKRYWLGLHLFTDVPIRRQALNGFGHWALGLPVSGLVAWLHHANDGGFPIALVLVLGPLPNVLREIRQYARTGSPHLLDRFRDAFEGGLGALTVYAVSSSGWAPF